MIRTLTLLTLLFTVAMWTLTEPAAAHSTKGRVKVDLTEKLPDADDFVYFMESYVHRELYRDKFEKWEKRFYVREFKSVDHGDERAVVRFLTLDAKNNDFFADEMVFSRDDDGYWHHTDEKGERVDVYTYIPKTRYYYETYVLPISTVGVLLGLVLLPALFWRRRWAKTKAEPTGGEAT